MALALYYSLLHPFPWTLSTHALSLTQLMKPYLEPKIDEEEVCVFPEIGYGLIEKTVLTFDVNIVPANVVLTMSNEGALADLFSGRASCANRLFLATVLPETVKCPKPCLDRCLVTLVWGKSQVEIMPMLFTSCKASFLLLPHFDTVFAGNTTTVVHLAMFSNVVLPETSSLVIYDEATPDAEIVGFILKYAHSQMCPTHPNLKRCRVRVAYVSKITASRKWEDRLTRRFGGTG